jgi:hypothetical protein
MLWSALWFKRNEPSKKPHLFLGDRAGKRLLACLLEVLGGNRWMRYEDCAKNWADLPSRLCQSSSCDMLPTLAGTIYMPMASNKSKYRPTDAAKSPEQYRRLADQCRETARTALARNERADLLAKAQLWDLLADRVGRPPRPANKVPKPTR